MILNTINDTNTEGSSALQPSSKILTGKIKKVCPNNYHKGISQEVFPFKKEEDIQKIKNYLLAKHRYRDHFYFTLGINTGMRVWDILNLKWIDLLDNNGDFKEKTTIREHKTGKFRTIYIKFSLKESLTQYYKSLSNPLPTDYVFKGQGTNQLKTNSAYRTIKRLAQKLKIPFNVGTHSLRKTFGYHQYKVHVGTDPLFINKLQRLFNHESSNTTLRYIGMEDEIQEQYYEDVQL